MQLEFMEKKQHAMVIFNIIFLIKNRSKRNIFFIYRPLFYFYKKITKENFSIFRAETLVKWRFFEVVIEWSKRQESNIEKICLISRIKNGI